MYTYILRSIYSVRATNQTSIQISADLQIFNVTLQLCSGVACVDFSHFNIGDVEVSKSIITQISIRSMGFRTAGGPGVGGGFTRGEGQLS